MLYILVTGISSRRESIVGGGKEKTAEEGSGEDGDKEGVEGEGEGKRMMGEGGWM